VSIQADGSPRRTVSSLTKSPDVNDRVRSSQALVAQAPSAVLRSGLGRRELLCMFHARSMAYPAEHANAVSLGCYLSLTSSVGGPGGVWLVTNAV